MKKVIIIRDQFSRDKTEATVDDVCKYLAEQFDKFPENARIYHNQISEQTDITPKTTADIEHLQSLDGEFYVVVHPSAIAAAAVAKIVFWVVTAISAAYSVYMIATMPKMRNSASGSPNNELAARSNQARLHSRIPDIYGQVRSYPDLISQTYTYYDSEGVEVERSLLCIGRGYYEIDDMRDASTDVDAMPTTSISVYDPNTSITGTPIFQSGHAFNDLPLEVVKSPSITGQTLDYPNDTKIESENIYFTADGKIHLDSGGLDDLFDVGDSILIAGAEFGTLDQKFVGAYELNTANKVVFESPVDYPNITEYGELILEGALVELVFIDEVPPEPPETEPSYVERKVYRDFSGTYPISSVIKTAISGGFNYQVVLSSPELVNQSWSVLNENKVIDASLTLSNNSTGIYLDDTYTIQSITQTEITLSNPAIVNSEWNDLLLLPNQTTQGMKKLINLDKVSNKWVGWYQVTKKNAERLIVNLHFPNGIYRQNSKGGTSSTYTDFALEYQVIDDDGNPLSSIIRYNRRFDGKTRSAFGRTITFGLPVSGSVRFRACRTRESNPNNEQATMNIKDVYLATASNKYIYEGVTVIQSEAIGSDGLYSLKERKLNCLVTRRLRVDGEGPLVATRDAGQALINAALDEHIGRRSLVELDIAQIKSEIQRVKTYFGSNVPAEFSYTFDDDNLSFEEQAAMIASACFCETYRYGSKLRLKFEAPQENSVLLFNHRNKVPGSEKRTFNLGIDKDYDGVALEYTSPDDDLRVTYTIPEDGPARNLLKISTSGIRNHAVAKTRAWREWNKLQHQAESVEFDALDESNLLVRNDRILVADNTSIKTQDGEVESVDGLILTLSQDVEMKEGVNYYIYLQLKDATVDMIRCLPGEFYNQVILTRVPLQPLVIAEDRYVKTIYQVVAAQDTASHAFLLTEATTNDEMTNKLTGTNYDSRYYEEDHSFI